jgi:hypothetical protein
MVPGGHWQLPATQVFPVAQATPHAPQFWGSVAALTHFPAQATVGLGQTEAQAPVAQA